MICSVLLIFGVMAGQNIRIESYPDRNGGGHSSQVLSRLRRIRSILSVLNELTVQLDIIDSDMLSRTSRHSSNKMCPMMVKRRCIPPCRKYFGRPGRKCTSKEKQRHIFYYLFLNLSKIQLSGCYTQSSPFFSW